MPPLMWGWARRVCRTVVTAPLSHPLEWAACGLAPHLPERNVKISAAEEMVLAGRE
jgi:hypothetical protein